LQEDGTGTRQKIPQTAGCETRPFLGVPSVATGAKTFDLPLAGSKPKTDIQTLHRGSCNLTRELQNYFKPH